MKKSWKISIGIIAGLLVVVVVVWMSPIGRFILKGGLSDLKEQPFESQQWKAARNGDLAAMHTRLMMVDDLLEKKIVIGMDSSSVTEMLGEPERQYGFSYSLGTLTEGIDPFFLIVSFDSVGTVNKLDVASEGKLKGESRALKIEIN